MDSARISRHARALTPASTGLVPEGLPPIESSAFNPWVAPRRGSGIREIAGRMGKHFPSDASGAEEARKWKDVSLRMEFLFHYDPLQSLQHTLTQDIRFSTMRHR